MEEAEYRQKMDYAKHQMTSTGSKDAAIRLYLEMVKGKTGKERLDAINKFRCG